MWMLGTKFVLTSDFTLLFFLQFFGNIFGKITILGISYQWYLVYVLIIVGKKHSAD
jgi:hypothetical protein